MSNLESFLADGAVAARILAHVRDGTTDERAGTWREPVASYRSPERLARELAVLRRRPVPFCPSAALSEPGSYVAREARGRAVALDGLAPRGRVLVGRSLAHVREDARRDRSVGQEGFEI